MILKQTKMSSDNWGQNYEPELLFFPFLSPLMWILSVDDNNYFQLDT